jgi:excisionase family DNA binding protein
MSPPTVTGQSRPRLLSVFEVADRLGVSVKTVRRMAARGDLPAHRIGRLLRVSEEDLGALLSAARSYHVGNR